MRRWDYLFLAFLFLFGGVNQNAFGDSNPSKTPPVILAQDLKDPNSFEFIYGENNFLGLDSKLQITKCDINSSVVCVYKVSYRESEGSSWIEGKYSGQNNYWTIGSINYKIVASFNPSSNQAFFLNAMGNFSANLLSVNLVPDETGTSYTNLFDGLQNNTYQTQIFVPSKVSNSSFWFFNRLIAGKVSTIPLNGGSIYSIEGKPMVTPVAAVGPASRDLLDPGQLTRDKISSWTEGPGGRIVRYISPQNNMVFYKSGVGNGDLSFQDFAGYEHKSILRTLYSRQIWSFTANSFPSKYFCGQINSSVPANIYSSPSNSVIGVSTTNASFYNPNPPIYDPKDGSLKYTVASPHFAEDSQTANEGYYSLKLKSDFAGCIWGNSLESAKATISVLSDGGVQQVATTTMGTSDGFIDFEAADFHYSTPTIKVSLTETIKCSKGKILKNISGVKPACPSGFRVIK
jgi:hypothetical protein